MAFRLRTLAEEEIKDDLRHNLEDGPWTSAVDIDSREVYFYKKDDSDDTTTWECPEGFFKEINWEG